MNRAAAAAAVLAAALPAAPAAAQTPDEEPAAWVFVAQRIHHSDALPLDDWDEKKHGRIAPQSGRNLAYIDDEARVERRQGAWAFALVARNQATLVADGQTLQLARLIEAGQRPGGDAHWRTDATFRGFSGAGFELRHALVPQPGWTLTLSAQLLALGSTHRRDIHGHASYEARSQSFDFDIASDQRYNRLKFDYQQPSARRGTGLLLGAGLRWADDSRALALDLFDGGRLHWNGLPRQTLSLAARRQGVDADGFVVYGPLLEGRNRQDDANIAQPWRARATAAQQLDADWRVDAGADWLPDYGALPWVGAGRRVGDALLRLQWRFHERRLSTSLDWYGWSLRLGADRLGSSAHSREAALAFRWPLP